MTKCISILNVAMDVHKKKHSIAYKNPQTGQLIEVVVHNNAKDIKKMVKRIMNPLYPYHPKPDHLSDPRDCPRDHAATTHPHRPPPHHSMFFNRLI